MMKTGRRTQLTKFNVGGAKGYVIEFGDGYIRIFYDHAPLKKGDEVVEIAAPYTQTDIWNEELKCYNLQFLQIGDVLYIFYPKYMKRLCRYPNDDWRLEDWEIINGPWQNVNTDDVTVTASGSEGEIVLTASANLFVEKDVGRLLRLTMVNDETTPWQADFQVSKSAVYTSDGKYYEAMNEGTTGNIKPVHSVGTKSDGVVVWKYLHDGSGIVKISEFVSATEVKANVVSFLPKDMTTSYFEFGLIYPGENYPMSGCFYKNRLWLLIDTNDGLKACGSYSGDFNNFADKEYGEVVAEAAVTVPVNSQEYNQGRWIAAADALFVGTSSGEFVIDKANSSAAMAADNVAVAQISKIGSKPIAPIAINGHLLFVDRFGTSIRDLIYSYERDGYDPVDASILGRHLLKSSIVDWDWQDIPNKLLWAALGDGRMLVFTFDANQQVAAMSQQYLSGAVESVAVIPSGTENRDDVWVTVKRKIDDTLKRYVEWIDEGTKSVFDDRVNSIEDAFEKREAEADYVRDNAFYLDSAIEFKRASGDMRTEIGGLEHLVGQTVGIAANGMQKPSQVVSKTGTVKVEETDTQVVVGLPICSQLMPQIVYLPNQSGAGLAEVQRIDHLNLFVYLSGGGQVGVNGNMCDILYYDSYETVGKVLKLKSGRVEIPWPVGHSLKTNWGADILIENKSIYPMQILAIVPSMSGS